MTYCTGSYPSLNISSCSLSGSAFMVANSSWSLQFAPNLFCSSYNFGSFCMGSSTSVSLSYSGTTGKANCVNDYVNVISAPSSNCLVTALCTADTPSIGISGDGGSCTAYPALNVTASSISF